MFNVNLKDSKMGHDPHSNPRDVGKSPKVVVRFKNWTHLISQKTQYIEISGITGKIVREMFNNSSSSTQNISGLKHTLYSSRQQCLLLHRAGILLVKDTKWLYRATFLNFPFGPRSRSFRIQAALQGLWTADSKGPEVWPFFLPRHNVKHVKSPVMFHFIFWNMEAYFKYS